MWATLFILICSSMLMSAQATELTDRILKCEAGLVNQKTCEEPVADKQELKKACENPVAYACSRAPPDGSLLTAQCKLTRNSVEGAAQLPEVMGVMKQIDDSEDQYVKEHRSECAFMGPPCIQQLQIMSPSAFQRITLKVAYTSERMNRLNALFSKVKTAAMEIAQASTRLTPSAKALILKRLKSTELRDPMKEFSPACYFRANGEASTGIYNEPFVKDSDPRVSICLGTMAMLDREDDASVMMALGHEITHSVDPCTLDALAIGTINPNGTQAYGELLDCLQGKVLHTNSVENEAAYCAEQIKIDPSWNLEDCQKQALKMPHCERAAKSIDETDMNLGNYRQGPGAVNQMAESYSDFFGAQIYAKVLKQESLIQPEVLSTNRKLQIIKALGADFSALHGVCLKENTNDVHPPGAIRVLNNILGNQEFGQLVCEKFKGKQCAGL